MQVLTSVALGVRGGAVRIQGLGAEDGLTSLISSAAEPAVDHVFANEGLLTTSATSSSVGSCSMTAASFSAFGIEELVVLHRGAEALGVKRAGIRGVELDVNMAPEPRANDGVRLKVLVEAARLFLR